MGKKKLSVGKIILRLILGLLALLVVFVLGVAVVNQVMLSKETKMLDEAGYYNLVSVGDYSVNTYTYGNENGKHNIVAMAGAGIADYCIELKPVTNHFSDENQIIFIDRAGYGLSDDTKVPQTVEQIINDYRTALNEMGIEAPYVLLPHSIADAYASYWVSEYPEEIEAVIILDGTQLSEDINLEDLENVNVISDKMDILMCKLGLYRVYSALNPFYPLTAEHTDEDQKLANALSIRTGWTNGLSSENANLEHNVVDTFKNLKTNDVPKLYICAVFGYTTEEEVKEDFDWVNVQLASMGQPTREYKPEFTEIILEQTAEMRETTIKPYLEKLGNCKLELLAGEHMIFQYKPDECAEIIMDFLDTLDN